jgi:hypothetical protein
VGVSPSFEVEEEEAAPPLLLDSLPGFSLLAMDKKSYKQEPTKVKKKKLKAKK